MVASGAVYLGHFVGRSDQDPTAVSTAQFAAMFEAGLHPSLDPLSALHQYLNSIGPTSKSQFVDLSVGRCLTIAEHGAVSSPVDSLGEERETVAEFRQIQVIVPVPSRRALAVFALSTECIIDWDDYVLMMAKISKTLKWRGGSNGTIARILNGS